MFRKFLSVFYPAVCVIALTVGCRNISTQISTVNVPAPVMTLSPDELLIPTDSTTSYFKGIRKKISVINYYQRFGNAPIWFKGRRPTPLADSMIGFIGNVSYYGLRPGRYHFDEIKKITTGSSDEVVILKELLLTDAFICLAVDLKSGLLKSRSLKVIDSLQLDLLHTAMLNGNIWKSLEFQEPMFVDYKSLKNGLGLLLDSLKDQVGDSVRLLERARLVSINLERWRNENVDLGKQYIFINIPSYTLKVMAYDSVIFSSKVIVGRPETETPIISSLVECFTIYPYWHVPRKIAVNEYLPVIKKDTSFISRNNFDVLDKKGNVLNPDSVQWNKFHTNYFPVVLRQREGTENSLGIIRFNFDNPYAVFLHDTNAKRLFGKSVRAFSHGCVRMERAVELAHFLVTDGAGESTFVSKFIKEKERHRVDLRRPIPIYIRYFTCEYVDGILCTYDDVYSKDNSLYDLLYNESFE